jgi:hypothetical protein
MFLVCAVCCQVEVSERGRSLGGGVLLSVAGLSVIEGPHRGGLGPLGLLSHEKKNSYGDFTQFIVTSFFIDTSYLLIRYKLFIDHIFVNCL